MARPAGKAGPMAVASSVSSDCSMNGRRSAKRCAGFAAQASSLTLSKCSGTPDRKSSASPIARTMRAAIPPARRVGSKLNFARGSRQSEQGLQRIEEGNRLGGREVAAHTPEDTRADEISGGIGEEGQGNADPANFVAQRS